MNDNWHTLFDWYEGKSKLLFPETQTIDPSFFGLFIGGYSLHNLPVNKISMSMSF